MRYKGLHITTGIVLFLVLTCSASAQLSPSLYDYPQNHLPWYTIESEHFLVHFQKGNSRSAQVASRIAEEVYPHITVLYDFEPNTRVNIILTDRQDYSNGAAYFFDNQIRIWVPALDSPLRGTHNWLRDVITHEFIHIVQLQASMKKNRRIPAVYLQWLSYEDVRRPDVLYGYPKGLLTHPFASISIPAWFAEGAAQYQRTGWFYDTWDTHRDMVLRSAILNENYRSLEDMGSFSSMNSLEREQVYNQGFAFVTYLVDQFGEEVLSTITEAFGQPGLFSIEEALQAATGKPASLLFDEWIQNRRKFYKDATASIKPQKSIIIEKEGFFNFYPGFSPNGDTIAYLSNKGRDESQTSLYIKNVNKYGETIAKLNLGSLDSNVSAHASCGFSENPSIEHIHSPYSFAPDGKRIAFTRRKLNAYGEDYDDLFIYNLQTGKEKRLTNSRRLSSPAWHPDRQTLVAIRQNRGTQNLVLVDIATGEITTLTGYSHGEQVFTPAWHPSGNSIYFAFSKHHSREIKRFDLEKSKISSVLGDPAIDYRDPFVDDEGLYLYYASDVDGIFNIYRIPVDSRHKSGEKLTNVIGGAFMPSVNKDSRLLYAEYGESGYKISSLNLKEALTQSPEGNYRPALPRQTSTEEAENYDTAITNYNDTDLAPFSDLFYSRADTGTVSFPLNKENPEESRTFYEYQETFTSLSFYPVVRFDNYTKKNGSNGNLIRSGRFGDLGENLLRDLKIGTYISSREVIDRLTIFGGALFGVGSRDADGIGNFFSPSRLSDLDRDLFLTTEYRGLPFIKKRWSPTLSLELQNLRRNVENGLTIEEFPCTSCLPDTLRADIAYNIWEADLFLRSKIDASNLVELGIGYTPYRVETQSFFSRELQQLIPSSSTEYFRGTFFSASHVLELFKPYRHRDVAPIGFRSFFKYTFENARLLQEYQIRDGTLSPVYEKSKNHTVEFNVRYGFNISDTYNHTGQLYSRFFSYLNDQDDSFYLDYIGGFTGMRSYPFFALGGTTTAYGQFSYIFPLVTNINKQFGRYTLDKLFLRVFTEAGNTWSSPLHNSSSLKTGIGSEIRFAFDSYYLFPLKLFVSTSYGFNRFDVTLPEEFITETPTGDVSYGKEILFHFGLTFDFNILNHE